MQARLQDLTNVAEKFCGISFFKFGKQNPEICCVSWSRKYKYDITGRPARNLLGTFFRPGSDPNHERIADILGIHESVIAKEDSYSCRCSSTLNIGNTEQKCLAHAAEVTVYAKQVKLGRWCFCGLRQEKFCIARTRTNHTKHVFTSSGK